MRGLRATGAFFIVYFEWEKNAQGKMHREGEKLASGPLTPRHAVLHRTAPGRDAVVGPTHVLRSAFGSRLRFHLYAQTPRSNAAIPAVQAAERYGLRDARASGGEHLAGGSKEQRQ